MVLLCLPAAGVYPAGKKSWPQFRQIPPSVRLWPRTRAGLVARDADKPYHAEDHGANTVDRERGAEIGKSTGHDGKATEADDAPLVGAAVGGNEDLHESVIARPSAMTNQIGSAQVVLRWGRKNLDTARVKLT